MSEAVFEKDFMSEKTCRVCGKRFSVLYPQLWRYKRDHGEKGKKDWFCSWGCLRASEAMKGETEDMGKRTKLSLEDKKQAVQVAIDGGDPREFLRSKGIVNTENCWNTIRIHLKDADPELYEKLPKRIPHNRKPRAKKEEPAKEATREDVMDEVRETVLSVNNGKVKPPKPLEPPLDFTVTGISTPIGEFRWYAKQKYLDWTPIGHDDNVSLNTYEWALFRLRFPDVLKILGVDLG